MAEGDFQPRQAAASASCWQTPSAWKAATALLCSSSLSTLPWLGAMAGAQAGVRKASGGGAGSGGSSEVTRGAICMCRILCVHVFRVREAARTMRNWQFCHASQAKSSKRDGAAPTASIHQEEQRDSQTGASERHLHSSNAKPCRPVVCAPLAPVVAQGLPSESIKQCYRHCVQNGGSDDGVRSLIPDH